MPKIHLQRRILDVVKASQNISNPYAANQWKPDMTPFFRF